jgi:hypothetical protein
MPEITIEDMFQMTMKWKAYAEEGDRIIEAQRVVLREMLGIMEEEFLAFGDDTPEKRTIRTARTALARERRH